MREYPRSLKKPNDRINSIRVYNEVEEYEASLKGYESHWDPEIIEKRKGTDRDILRKMPEMEVVTAVKREPIEQKIIQTEVIPTIPEPETVPETVPDLKIRKAPGRPAHRKW